MILSGSLVLFGLYWLLMLPSYRRWPGASCVATTLTLIFLFVGIGSGDLLAFGLMLLMATAFAICRSRQASFSKFLVGAGCVLGVALAATLPRMLEIGDLLNRYPAESLVERLAPPTATAVAQEETVIPDDFQTVAQAIETELQRESHSWTRRRPDALARLDGLHRVAIKVFQDAPGFGVTRVRQMPIRKSVIDLPEMVPIPQPSPRPIELVTAGQEGSLQFAIPPDVTLDVLQNTHLRGIANFANPAGFGYSPQMYSQWSSPKSKLEHVVGFQPHGFRELPKVADGQQLTKDQSETTDSAWEVERLDLMSLLLHDPPVVYVSENVPSMGELRTSPTRSLSQFESDCLAQIKEGESLVTGSTAHAIRMLGAIRATESCLQCHDVPKGRLLGAFSYVLRRKSPPRDDEQLAPIAKPLS